MGKRVPEKRVASEAKGESFTNSGALGHGGRLGVQRWCPTFTHCKALGAKRQDPQPRLPCPAYKLGPPDPAKDAPGQKSMPS